jgi:hypothetical protein
VYRGFHNRSIEGRASDCQNNTFDKTPASAAPKPRRGAVFLLRNRLSAF